MNKEQTKAWLIQCRNDLCWLKRQIATEEIHKTLSDREYRGEDYFCSAVSGSFVRMEYDSTGNLQGVMRYTDDRLKRLMIYILRRVNINLVDGGYLK